MKDAVVLILLFITLVYCQPSQQDEHFQATVTVVVGPQGPCSAVPTVVIEVVPVYFTQYFSQNTVIEPFGNGFSFTISNAPTEVRITSTLTATSYPKSLTIPFEKDSATAVGPENSIGRLLEVPSRPVTAPYLGDALNVLRLPTGVAGPPPSSLTPFFSARQSITTSLASSIQATTTQASSSTGKNSEPSGLRIGQGLPTGFYQDLSSTQFIFLAFTDAPVPEPRMRRRRNVHRRRSTAITRPIIALNLAQTEQLMGGVNQDFCDSSTPMLLQSGALVQYEDAVGKFLGDRESLLGFLNNNYLDAVNGTFSLVDGFLRWDAPDKGSAVFYNCAGNLFAIFEAPPNNSDCVQVLVGAIAGQACLDRVQATRDPDSTFTAPRMAPLRTVSIGSVFVTSADASSSGSGSPKTGPRTATATFVSSDQLSSLPSTTSVTWTSTSIMLSQHSSLSGLSAISKTTTGQSYLVAATSTPSTTSSSSTSTQSSRSTLPPQQSSLPPLYGSPTTSTGTKSTSSVTTPTVLSSTLATITSLSTAVSTATSAATSTPSSSQVCTIPVPGRKRRSPLAAVVGQVVQFIAGPQNCVTVTEN